MSRREVWERSILLLEAKGVTAEFVWSVVGLLLRLNRRLGGGLLNQMHFYVEPRVTHNDHPTILTGDYVNRKRLPVV